MLFDIFFLIFTLVLGIVGMFFRLQISKLCIFFFFIKFYFAVCVYSLFKNPMEENKKKASDKISIHSSASQHLTAVDVDDEADESPGSARKPGLGEAPMAVAV